MMVVFYLLSDDVDGLLDILYLICIITGACGWRHSDYLAGIVLYIDQAGQIHNSVSFPYKNGQMPFPLFTRLFNANWI